ncbi:MAG: hypothetical protein ACI3XQ_02445, partial [Eubacteriales bacterium]
MKPTNKVLSFILAVLFVLTGIGGLFTVSAEDVETAANIVYLDGSAGDGGTGTLEAPFNSLASAIAKLKEANTDGTIVITGPVTITGDAVDWKIGGTLTITSVDPVTSTDYRKANCTGAYLRNDSLKNLTGANLIVLEHLDFATPTGGAGAVCFKDHDLIVRDVTNWRSSDWVTFTSNHWNFGFNKNDSGRKTVLTLDTTSGNIALGTPNGISGSTKTTGIDLTVDNCPNIWQGIILGNR